MKLKLLLKHNTITNRMDKKLKQEIVKTKTAVNKSLLLLNNLIFLFY